MMMVGIHDTVILIVCCQCAEMQKKAWLPYWICTMMTSQANQFGYI